MSKHANTHLLQVHNVDSTCKTGPDTLLQVLFSIWHVWELQYWVITDRKQRRLCMICLCWKHCTVDDSIQPVFQGFWVLNWPPWTYSSSRISLLICAGVMYSFPSSVCTTSSFFSWTSFEIISMQFLSDNLWEGSQNGHTWFNFTVINRKETICNSSRFSLRESLQLALLLAAAGSVRCGYLCTVSANCARWKSAASRRISSQSAAIVTVNVPANSDSCHRFC